MKVTSDLIESDEKRWRWAWQKIKVFGLLKRNWKVYIQIVPNCKADSLLPIIRGKVDTNSIINTEEGLWLISWFVIWKTL